MTTGARIALPAAQRLRTDGATNKTPRRGRGTKKEKSNEMPLVLGRAHGVVESLPLSMREALGSIPSVSIAARSHHPSLLETHQSPIASRLRVEICSCLPRRPQGAADVCEACPDQMKTARRRLRTTVRKVCASSVLARESPGPPTGAATSQESTSSSG